MQILEHIFTYLSIDERKTASLVCKKWLETAFSYNFAKLAPLTFEHCVFRGRTKPKSIFIKSGTNRIFPRIVIGNVEERPPYSRFRTEGKLLGFYETMRQIGNGTIHVTLTETNPPESVLSCFPILVTLDLVDLNDFSKFDVIPETIQNIHAQVAKAWIPEDVYNRIKSLPLVKVLKCTKLDLTRDKSQPNMVNFIKLTDNLDKFLNEHAIAKVVKISSNLASQKSIDFKDITGLTLNDGFINFKQLSQVVHLKVSPDC